MTKTAIEIYSDPKTHPSLTVPQHVIVRAVRSLGKIEALALIRGAYDADLASAREIYYSIMKR